MFNQFLKEILPSGEILKKSFSVFLLNLKSKTNKSLLYNFWPVIETLALLISITFIWEAMFNTSRIQFGSYLSLFYIFFEFINNYFQRSSKSLSDFKGLIINGLESRIFFINNLIILECMHQFLLRLIGVIAFYLIANLPIILILKYIIVSVSIMPLIYLFFSSSFYFISITGLFFSDTNRFLAIIFRVLFFISPILWIVDDMTDEKFILLFSIFNPIYNFIKIIYKFTFFQSFSYSSLLFIFIQTLFLFIISYIFFKKFNNIYKSWL